MYTAVNAGGDISSHTAPTSAYSLFPAVSSRVQIIDTGPPLLRFWQLFKSRMKIWLPVRMLEYVML
ncbi:MAG: hypothetical protein QW728_07555 [Thermoplasmata archaeon]